MGFGKSLKKAFNKAVKQVGDVYAGSVSLGKYNTLTKLGKAAGNFASKATPYALTALQMGQAMQGGPGGFMNAQSALSSLGGMFMGGKDEGSSYAADPYGMGGGDPYYGAYEEGIAGPYDTGTGLGAPSAQELYNNSVLAGLNGLQGGAVQREAQAQYEAPQTQQSLGFTAAGALNNAYVRAIGMHPRSAAAMDPYLNQSAAAMSIAANAAYKRPSIFDPNTV
jgi:hypothetical protein